MVENQVINLTEESLSVQAHLVMLQNVIQRMASNSSSCKSWCITLVSAVLVIVADKGKPDYAWIALLPTAIFACLDAYYLALEKSVRKTYNKFVDKLHNKSLISSDLYAIKPQEKMLKHQVAAIKSMSVWGFYIPLVFLIYTTKIIAIG
jgi:small basic protein